MKTINLTKNSKFDEFLEESEEEFKTKYFMDKTDNGVIYAPFYNDANAVLHGEYIIVVDNDMLEKIEKSDDPRLLLDACII